MMTSGITLSQCNGKQSKSGAKNPVNVVYISGFLTPTNFVCYPEETIPDNVNIITVYPSPVGSLHDRACQIFYELMGGQVDFGEEHSRFHCHERFGRTFTTGKLPSWSVDEPIILIGHSFGGATALTLHNYLAQGRFPGYDTNAAWISGIIGVNTPYNGALQVYNKGMDILQPILIHWLSSGHIITCISQLIEYLDYGWIRQYFNPDLGMWLFIVIFALINLCLLSSLAHWRLDHRQPHSLLDLMLIFCGYGILSHTDHLAYDTSVQSQMQWQQSNRCFPCTRYVSIVGNIMPSADQPFTSMPWSQKLTYLFDKYCRGKVPQEVAGLDVSQWNQHGCDGLLSVHTQELPHLIGSPTLKRIATFNTDVVLERGIWHCHYTQNSHLAAAFKDKAAWTTIMAAVDCIVANQNIESSSMQTRSSQQRSRWSHEDVRAAVPHDQPDMQAHRLYLAACHPPVDKPSGLLTMIIKTILLSLMVLFKMNVVFSSAVDDDLNRLNRNVKSLVFVFPVVLSYFFLSLDFKQIPFVVIQSAELLFAALRALLLATSQDYDFIVALFFVEAIIFSVGFSLWSKHTRPLCKLVVAAVFDTLLVQQSQQQSLLVAQIGFFNLIPLLPSIAWIVVFIEENTRTFEKIKVSKVFLEVMLIVTSWLQWGLMLALLFICAKLGMSMQYTLSQGTVLNLVSTLAAMIVMMTKGNDLFRCVSYCLIKRSSPSTHNT